MQEKLRRYGLLLCLFVFLYVILGSGLRLFPAGALAAALSGAPLVIFAFNRWAATRVHEQEKVSREEHQVLFR